MIAEQPSVYALILAGGAGTRFWPASRSARPKQLLPLLGGDPLLLETANRVLPLCQGTSAEPGWSRILVASGRHIAEPTAALLPDLPAANLLVEPLARNTAPCIGWAAAWLARRAPEAVMMVLPSDHHIADVVGFRAALERAVASARRGVITTIGIRPTHPETGYGYIEFEDKAASSGDALAVRRFVEKPPRKLAEEFVASGRYLWNAGMFFFRARDMLAAIRAHLPALADGLDALDRAAAAGREQEELLQTFRDLPSISIDKGVMEHMDKLAVIPGDFGWNDVGSWESAWALAPKDARGNTAPEGTVLIDSADNQVVDLRSGDMKKRVIALVGVEDLVVVETDDALLIVPRARSQDVKAVVESLKARGDLHLV
jgi:mannose-1-phosphate guanylyltransferase